MENLTGSNSVKKAKVVSVIQVEAKIGTGTKEDPDSGYRSRFLTKKNGLLPDTTKSI